MLATEIGLAFETSPVLASRQNQAILRAIVGGDRGVSWRGRIEHAEELVSGERMRVIYGVHDLHHVGPTGVPVFPAPTTWASHEDFTDAPIRLRQLVQKWEASRTALRVKAKRPATVSVEATMSRRRDNSRGRPVAAATRPQPAPEFDWREPPAGMSRDDWEWFGHMEAAGRRAMQNRVRARNRRST